MDEFVYNSVCSRNGASSRLLALPFKSSILHPIASSVDLVSNFLRTSNINNCFHYRQLDICILPRCRL